MKKLSFKNFRFVIPPVLIFLFFLPNLILGQIPMPADSLLGLYHPWRDNSYSGYAVGRFPTKNPLITDPVLQTYPWRKLVINNFKERKLPLWNPYSFSGQPLLANAQSAYLQISNLFFFVFPLKTAWAFQVILPPVLTGLFMYLFLRNLKLSTASSAFGASILPFSGFFVSWMTWGTVITTAMWLPLILLCIDKLFEKLKPLYFLLLTISVFQTIVSGHFQTALYVLLVSVLYLLFNLFKTKSKASFLTVILSIVFALIISLPQLLPSLEFINYSNRQTDQGYSQNRRDWFLPPQNLIQMVAPDFFGNPTTNNYWGIWNYAEFISFIGIIPLFFALLALSKKESKVLFFIFLIILSLLLAIKNPISKLPYILNLPFISSIQPSRIIFVLVFSMSTISAYGLESFLKEKFKKMSLISSTFLFCSILILIFFAAFKKELFPVSGGINSSYIAFRNLAIPLLFASFLFLIILLKALKVPNKILILIIFSLSLIELFKFSYKFTPFSKISLIFPEARTTSFLENQKRPFRIMTTDRRILNGNTSSVYNIESVSGYDPLYLSSYAQLVTAWESGNIIRAGSFNRFVTPQKYDSQITNLLNVKYIVTFDEISNKNFNKVFEEGETKIYQNNNVLPRAFFVNEVIKAANSNDELFKLISKNFNIRTAAVSTEFGFQKVESKSDLIPISYSDQSLSFKTVTETELPLVVSNIYYPGWKVYIDGTNSTLNKTDYILQSVFVPKGIHQVEFKYQPESFYNGLYLAILGIILSGLYIIYLWRLKYR